MANEYLSRQEAAKIGTQYKDLVDGVIGEIQTGFNDFFADMEREWEDKHAVKFAGDLKQAMSEVTDHLKQNCEKFRQTINEIAKAYGTTGGIDVGTVVAEIVPRTLTITENIKETFDGDKFGFMNVDSHDKIARAITSLISKIDGVKGSIPGKIAQIDSFGNEEVKQNLGKSGGTIVEILQDAIKEVEIASKENLQKAAEAYMQTGTKAAEAANIGKGA